MRWLQAVIFRLPDPDAAKNFFVEHMEFTATELIGGGWRLENGAMTLIFHKGKGHTHELEVECDDVVAESTELLALDGISSQTPLKRTHHRVEQQLLCTFGITLTLIKNLDEDERGDLPPLPASLEWNEATDLLTRRILRFVPIAFRSQARKRATQSAEFFAVEDGALCVEEHHAMKGFVDATLDFQHQTLKEAMAREGIDASLYIPPPCDP